MTVLSAIQDATVVLGVGPFNAIYGVVADTEQELAYLANEAASQISKAHDWTALRTSITVPGPTSSYSAWTDFERLPKDASMLGTNDLWPVMAFDTFQRTQQRAPTLPKTIWAISGGAAQFYPAIPDGESRTFDYITANNAQMDGGGARAGFAADDDTFLLPERLLTLSIIWQWRKQKALPYAEDMQSFEIALDQEIAADMGMGAVRPGASV